MASKNWRRDGDPLKCGRFPRIIDDQIRLCNALNSFDWGIPTGNRNHFDLVRNLYYNYYGPNIHVRYHRWIEGASLVPYFLEDQHSLILVSRTLVLSRKGNWLVCTTGSSLTDEIELPDRVGDCILRFTALLQLEKTS